MSKINDTFNISTMKNLQQKSIYLLHFALVQGHKFRALSEHQTTGYEALKILSETWNFIYQL